MFSTVVWDMVQDGLTQNLSNTHLAMEALFYAKKSYQNNEGDFADLDWDAAISFVSKCQNLPSTNNEKWVSKDEDDLGGFVYFPGNSMAGERKMQMVPLHYGHMGA